MFDNPTDNHADIEFPLYDKLRFHEAKNVRVVKLGSVINEWYN